MDGHHGDAIGRGVAVGDEVVFEVLGVDDDALGLGHVEGV